MSDRPTETNPATDDPALAPWRESPIGAVIDHLLETYHEPHRVELARLTELARRTQCAYGDRDDWPGGLPGHLERMHEAMEDHMRKEEMVLFPMIRRGDGRHAQMPVMVMTREHEDHESNLARLRALTNHFEPPADADDAWRELYAGLSGLASDLTSHMRLENEVLFPRALRS